MKGYRAMLPGLALGLVATGALADTVGGVVDPINLLSSVSYATDLNIDAGLSNAVIVSGTINDNHEHGWDLTVESENLGKLQIGTGGAGRELAYNNITFVRTSTASTLGTGLNDPNGTQKNIASGEVGGTPGTIHFNTRDTLGVIGTATSATVNYTFQLQITAAANPALLAGTYTDDITLTLNNDT